MNEDNPLTADLPCVICGYSLRELATDASCPECGTVIARSQRGDDLSCASPQWLNLLRMGVAFHLAASIHSFMPWYVIVPSLGPLSEAMRWGRALLGPSLVVGAAWLISVREPRLKGQPFPRLHVLLRVCAMVLFAVSRLDWTNIGWRMSAPGWAGVALFGIWAAANVAWYVILIRLASRCGDTRLARSTRIVMVGLIAVQVFGFVVHWTSWDVSEWLRAAQIAFRIGAIVIASLYLVLLTRVLSDARRPDVHLRMASQEHRVFLPDAVQGWAAVAAGGGCNG